MGGGWTLHGGLGLRVFHVHIEVVVVPALVIAGIDGAGEEFRFALLDLGGFLAFEFLLAFEGGETGGFTLFGFFFLTFFLGEALKRDLAGFRRFGGLAFAFSREAGGFAFGGETFGGEAFTFGGGAAGVFFFLNAARFRSCLFGADAGLLFFHALGFTLGLQRGEALGLGLGGGALALGLGFALGLGLSFGGEAGLFFARLFGLEAAVAKKGAGSDDEKNENGNDFTVHNGNDLL